MAQPPNTSDTFLREVDENLRRDRARDFAKKYGVWLIAGVVLFLAAAGGYIYWQQRQLQQSEARVEQLAQVYREIAGGNLQRAVPQVDAIAKQSSGAVAASALLTRAALAVEQNDLPLAIAKFREVASDEDMPEPYRHLALIRQTALEFDRLRPEEVISRMAPLSKAGNPWFGSAGELSAAALIKQNKSREAGQLFGAIAKDQSVPEAMRARSAQIAATLGVDASSALSTAAQ